jgi:hypothetical protein
MDGNAKMKYDPLKLPMTRDQFMNMKNSGTIFDETAGKVVKDEFDKIMQTPEGRFVLMHLVELTGYRENTFTRDSRTFYNEGRRSIGIWIMETMTAASLKLRQQAEREYAEKVAEVKDITERKLK